MCLLCSSTTRAEDKGMKNMFLKTLKNVNLALAFGMELAALVALVYWAFAVGPTMLAKIGLAVGALVVVAVIWSLFGAPRSKRRLHGLWLLLLRVIVFGSAAVFLYIAGQPVLGIIFAVVFLLNCALATVWGQESVSTMEV